jgi:hypothetical protein
VTPDEINRLLAGKPPAHIVGRQRHTRLTAPSANRARLAGYFQLREITETDMTNQTNNEDEQLCETYGGCDQRAAFRVTVRSCNGGSLLRETRRVTGYFCEKHYDSQISGLRRYAHETTTRI